MSDALAASVVMVLAHLLGDFYLQPDAMARGKSASRGWMLAHVALYTAMMLAALLCLPAASSWRALVAAVVLGLSHLIVDAVIKPRLARVDGLGTWASFVIDQLAHLLFCVGAGAIVRMGAPQGVGPLASGETRVLLAAVAAFALVGRPAEIAVRELLLVVDDPREKGTPGSAALLRAGRYIGILERVIVVTLTLLGQYSAIAFVIAAKSVARYKTIEENPAFAERYLVGTLASLSIAMLGTMAFMALATGRVSLG